LIGRLVEDLVFWSLGGKLDIFSLRQYMVRKNGQDPLGGNIKLDASGGDVSAKISSVWATDQ